MNQIFKFLVASLIAKTAEFYQQLNQEPLLKDNYLLSVIFIDFKKLKPKKKLDTEIYIQILLLYAIGWLSEYLDEMQKEDDGNLTQNFLLCRFYKYIINGDLKINNKTEFLLLQSDVSTHINNERMAEEKQKVIMLMGRWSAASYKGGDEVDSSLALILNEWMQFKVLK